MYYYLSMFITGWKTEKEKGATGYTGQSQGRWEACREGARPAEVESIHIGGGDMKTF